jgi:hypothetical protein
MHTEYLRRIEGFVDASHAELFALGEYTRFRFSKFTPGGDHEYHAVTRRRGLRHQTTGRNGFIIGMCMKADERCHYAIAPLERSESICVASA